MSTLIPEVQFNEFKRLTADQLKRLKCCEIFDGEAYLFTFVNPTTDYVRVHTEYTAQTSNSVGGENLDQILADMPEPEIYVSDKPSKPKKRRKKKAKS